MSDVLKDLQPELKTLLQSVPLFTDSEVTVIEELRGDTGNEVDRELAKLGVAVIVSPPTLRPTNANVTTARGIASCEVLIIEKSTSVGDGVEALQAVAAIISHVAEVKPDRTRQALWKLNDRGFRPGLYKGKSDVAFYAGTFEREVRVIPPKTYEPLIVEPTLQEQVAALSPHAWFMADTGVEEAADDVAEDGDRVRYWRDQSGNGGDLEQATALNQPVFNESGNINSQPVLSFSGSERMLNTSLALAQSRGVIMVLRPTATNIVLYAGNTSWTPFFILDSGGASRIYAGSYVTVTDAWTSGTAHISRTGFNGSESYHQFNNNSKQVNMNLGSGFDLGLVLGDTPSFGNGFRGDIAEFLIMPLLGDSDYATVLEFLNNKYAIY